MAGLRSLQLVTAPLIRCPGRRPGSALLAIDG